MPTSSGEPGLGNPRSYATVTMLLCMNELAQWYEKARAAYKCLNGPKAIMSVSTLGQPNLPCQSGPVAENREVGVRGGIGTLGVLHSEIDSVHMYNVSLIPIPVVVRIASWTRGAWRGGGMWSFSLAQTKRARRIVCMAPLDSINA